MAKNINANIPKEKFFKNLKDYIGKKIVLVGSGSTLAKVVVVANKDQWRPFKITLEWVGRQKEKRENGWNCSLTDTIVCRDDFDSLNYTDKQEFAYRAFKVIEPEVKEVKQIAKVVVEGKAKEPGLPTFAELETGAFFWYDKTLYQKDDEGGAIDVLNGYYVAEDDWDTEVVVPQNVRIVCVD